MLFATVALASAFNLVCGGTMSVRDANYAFSTPSVQDMTETYRIDLERKRWCVEDCVTTHPIAEAEPTNLTLEDSSTPTDGIHSYVLTVNRESGSMVSTLVMTSGVEVRTMLRCKPQPFGGFPAVKF